MATQQKIGTHATTVGRDSDGTIRVTYHATVVVTVRPDGRVELRTGGYRTATTKTRMNQAANQLGLGFTVYQHAHDWFVHTGGRDVPFVEGMVIGS